MVVTLTQAALLLAGVVLVPHDPACVPGWLDLDAAAGLLTIELGPGLRAGRIELHPLPCGEAASVVGLEAACARRTVPLHDVPPANRTRVVALAAAELLRTCPAAGSQLARAGPPAPGAPRAGEAGPPPPGAPKRGRFDVTAGAAVRAHPGTATVLVGPSASLVLRLAGSVLGEVGGSAAFHRTTRPSGVVRLTTVQGHLSVLVGTMTPRFTFGLGPAVEAGWGGVDGPEAADGAVLSVGLRAVGRVGLGPWRLGLFAGAGWSVLGVEARLEDRLVSGTSGAAVQLGLMIGAGG